MEPGNKDTGSCLSARLNSLCGVVIQLTPPSNLKNQAVTPQREKLYSLKLWIEGAFVISLPYSTFCSIWPVFTAIKNLFYFGALYFVNTMHKVCRILTLKYHGSIYTVLEYIFLQKYPIRDTFCLEFVFHLSFLIFFSCSGNKRRKLHLNTLV